MTWTEEDRIREVRRNTQLLSKALYDGEGTRRVHLHHVSHQEETAYLGQHLTLRDGKYITKHIYAGDTHIASKRDPDWFQQPPTLYFHTDHLGSASFVSNDQQELVQHAEYFPTGELWQDESDSRYEHYRRYLFNGKEMDISTGLFHYGARHYDPRLGLWMSPDPILDRYMRGEGNYGVYTPVNLALYTYVGNRPVVARDPDGRLFDIFVDAAFITFDIAMLAYDEVATGGENRAVNLAALGVDVAMLFVPFATGGGAAVRGGHALNANRRATQGAVQTTRAATHAGEGARGAGHAVESGASAGVHGNSKAASGEQHVYEVLRHSDEGTEVYKYGISGGRVRRDGQSARAESQVRGFNREAKKAGPSTRYESSVVEKIPAKPGARGQALDSEKRFVEQYRELTGRKPAGNKRP